MKKSAIEADVLNGEKKPASKVKPTAPTKGKKQTTKAGTKPAPNAVGKKTQNNGGKTKSLASGNIMGRPSVYDPTRHPEQAFRLSILGLSDERMANVMLISEATLNKWKLDHPEFSERYRAGKSDATSRVAASLFERAVGYSHPDVHISAYKGEITETPIMKHYPPDPAAAQFFLKNKQADLWRDRTVTEVVGKDDGPIQTETGTATDYAAIRAAIRAKKEA